MSIRTAPVDIYPKHNEAMKAVLFVFVQHLLIFIEKRKEVIFMINKYSYSTC